MRLSHEWSRATPVFDDENLVSCVGLVPVVALAEQAGLSSPASGIGSGVGDLADVIAAALCSIAARRPQPQSVDQTWISGCTCGV